MKRSEAAGSHDFLGHVIACAHEEALVIAPRPVSLFEPASSGYSAAVDEAELAERIAPSVPRQIDARAEIPEAPGPASPVAAEPVAIAPPPLGLLAPTPIQARSAPGIAAAPLRTQATPRAREIAPHAAVPDVSGAARETPHVATPNPVYELAHEAEQGDGRPVQVRVVPESNAHMQGRTGMLLPVPVALPAQQAPSVPRRDVATTPAPSATQNVTIHIGRVEVRAPATAAPKPAHTPPQPMRLEEYLSRKERGR